MMVAVPMPTPSRASFEAALPEEPALA